jgi:peroxiredoxin
MPELQAAYEEYASEGLAILALDQDEPAEVARAFFEDEMGLTFTALLDERSVVATTYGSFGVLPTSYFIDRDGVVTAIHRGPMTARQIAGYLAATFSPAS